MILIIKIPGVRQRGKGCSHTLIILILLTNTYYTKTLLRERIRRSYKFIGLRGHRTYNTPDDDIISHVYSGTAIKKFIKNKQLHFKLSVADINNLRFEITVRGETMRLVFYEFLTYKIQFIYCQLIIKETQLRIDTYHITAKYYHEKFIFLYFSIIYL